MGPEMTFNTDLQCTTVLEGYCQLAQNLNKQYKGANQVLLLKLGAAGINGLAKISLLHAGLLHKANRLKFC